MGGSGPGEGSQSPGRGPGGGPRAPGVWGGFWVGFGEFWGGLGPPDPPSVCTQLLVSRPDEENITSYLQLLEKCLSHEAFTETQKKRLQSWKQQVLKLLRAFPKKGPLDGPPGYRPPKSWAFGSNSLPI
ncbi:protein Smaug homolog 2-like, partial [Onychostruthus taczanowskii]|uniref:protein Smaug homolog 2-like n=1 Tax=Onychostruthus taczanowskii TaxID=356909 RepID=UPI001B80AA8B